MRSSVLVNNYNQASFLADCIDSLLAQTQPADEIVVYDDGSTDHSLEVLRRYGARIEVIAGQRVNRPGAINQAHAIHQAFLRSTGDVVFLLDGDDVFTPGKIAAFIAAFATDPHPVLVQAPMGWMNSDGEPMPRMAESFRHAADPLAAAYALQDPDLFYPTSGLAFARTFLEKALPIDWSDGVPLWADTRLCLAALLSGPVITLADEFGIKRHHTRSDSAKAARNRSYQVLQTWRRTRVFNRLCRHHGRPPVSVWRNRRFYFQLLRALSPEFLNRAYDRRRNVEMSPAPGSRS